MKKIPIGHGKFALVDDEDFEYLNQFTWWSHNAGYAVRQNRVGNGKYKNILMHRIINNTPEGLYTDHVNSNRLDNRKTNLRIATPQQNQMNRRKAGSKSSRYKGVNFKKERSKWGAHIKINGVQKHLGYFICEVVAAAHYDMAAERYFGEFAKTNL